MKHPEKSTDEREETTNDLCSRSWPMDKLGDSGGRGQPVRLRVAIDRSVHIRSLFFDAWHAASASLFLLRIPNTPTVS